MLIDDQAATTEGLKTSSSTDLLHQLSPTRRRSLARTLRRTRAAAATELAKRHATYPILARSVAERMSGWDEYRRRYLVPLLYTLERGLQTGEPHYLDIYRAQRTRFYPREVLAAGGQRELEAVLDDDREVLTRQADGSEAMGELVEAVNRPLCAGQLARSIKVGLIGDCVMNEISSFLAPLLLGSGIRLEGQQFYFSSNNKLLDVDEVKAGLQTYDFDLLSMSFLTLEGLPLYTALIHESQTMATLTTSAEARCEALLLLADRFVAEVRELTNKPILLHGCCGLPLTKVRRYLPLVPAMARGQQLVAQRLDEGLAALADGVENVVFIDEVAAVRSIGARAANARLIPRTLRPVFHPSNFGRAVAPQYDRVARAYTALAKTKVLLVDFDNTLWQGVMADGDVVHDVEGQRLLHTLKDAGLLLVSLSKNDPRTIRWDELALEEDDFVLHKIGWASKPRSVLEAAEQLDLDPRSFVLLDDNPVERELVVKAVPGVTALDPLDAETWDFLRLLLKFPATRQTAEAGRRTLMYREAAQRREAQSADVDLDEMMHSLQLTTRWRAARRSDLDRLDELVNRTSQFNTTTIRCSRAELAALVSGSDRAVYVASLSDKFGDLGIVGASIVSWSGTELRFENVVMSCRAMGFGLETQLVRGALDDPRGATVAIGRYLPTERNNPCAALFSSLGFAPDGEHDWRLPLDRELPAVPDWLNVQQG